MKKGPLIKIGPNQLLLTSQQTVGAQTDETKNRQQASNKKHPANRNQNIDIRFRNRCQDSTKNSNTQIEKSRESLRNRERCLSTFFG